MNVELYEGVFCRLRNGRVTGPALPVSTMSGHQFLVDGLYYTVAGECQAGREFDVISCGCVPQGGSVPFHNGAEVIAIASGHHSPSRMAATTQDHTSASLNGGAEVVRTITIAVATSFGQISGEVSFTSSGVASISGQCLQIANGEPIPVTERSLDRCGVLYGEKWWTFRELLVDRATREVAA